METGPVESGCVALNVPLMRLCGAGLLVLPTLLVASSKKCQIDHRAGAAGFGSSSYIDSMLLREKDTRDSSDAIQPPYAAADSARDQTLYYVQNWRADVVALLNESGRAVEHVRYTAYGSPRRLNMNPVDTCAAVLIPNIPKQFQVAYHSCVIGCWFGAAFGIAISCPACAACVLSKSFLCMDLCGF